MFSIQMMNGSLLVIEVMLNGRKEWMKSYKQQVQPKDSDNMRWKMVKRLVDRNVNNWVRDSEKYKDSQKKMQKLSLIPSLWAKLKTKLPSGMLQVMKMVLH